MPIKDPAALAEYKRHYKARRKKPLFFPPCSHGRHSRCAFTVWLAGHLFSKCQCRCHAGQPIHEPKPKENHDYE